MPDSQLDLSDIPESTAAELRAPVAAAFRPPSSLSLSGLCSAGL